MITIILFYLINFFAVFMLNDVMLHFVAFLGIVVMFKLCSLYHYVCDFCLFVCLHVCPKGQVVRIAIG